MFHNHQNGPLRLTPTQALELVDYTPSENSASAYLTHDAGSESEDVLEVTRPFSIGRISNPVHAEVILERTEE